MRVVAGVGVGSGASPTPPAPAWNVNQGTRARELLGIWLTVRWSARRVPACSAAAVAPASRGAGREILTNRCRRDDRAMRPRPGTRTDQGPRWPPRSPARSRRYRAASLLESVLAVSGRGDAGGAGPRSSTAAPSGWSWFQLRGRLRAERSGRRCRQGVVVGSDSRARIGSITATTQSSATRQRYAMPRLVADAGGGDRRGAARRAGGISERCMQMGAGHCVGYAKGANLIRTAISSFPGRQTSLRRHAVAVSRSRRWHWDLSADRRRRARGWRRCARQVATMRRRSSN